VIGDEEMITELHFDSDDNFIRRCCECGEEASFGYRVRLRRNHISTLMKISSIAAASAARKPRLASACVCAGAHLEAGTAQNTAGTRRRQLTTQIQRHQVQHLMRSTRRAGGDPRRELKVRSGE
jgi:hypothetical protein